jgi:hypothetical protein
MLTKLFPMRIVSSSLCGFSFNFARSFAFFLPRFCIRSIWSLVRLIMAISALEKKPDKKSKTKKMSSVTSISYQDPVVYSATDSFLYFMVQEVIKNYKK